MLEKEKRKDNRKSILYSAIVLLVVALIIGVLMIVRYCVPKKENGTPKQEQLLLFTPSLIDENTSLSEKSLLFNVKDGTNTYIASLTISSGESNAQIPSYSNPTYLYRSYGMEINALAVSIAFYTINEHGTKGDVYTGYEDLSFIISLGNTESHSVLDPSSYTVNNNTLNYSQTGDIFLYSVNVSVKL